MTGQTDLVEFNPAETPAPPRQAAEAGAPCPQCGQGMLDYDSLLNLVCPLCGFVEGGGCT